MKRQAKRLVVTAWLIAVSAWPSSARPDESSAAADAQPAPTADEIAAWITDLDDGRYLARERATQRLVAAGTAALDPLLAAANGERPEPADRAIWILRRLGRSRDNDLAIAALERLVQLQGRPVLVAKAETDLAERSVAACQERLGPLGADVQLEIGRIDVNTAATILHIRLNENWHGTAEDLRVVPQLSQQLYFRLEGAAIDDAVVKMFERRERLAFLQLVETKVTPDAVDSLKKRHPESVVFLRNQAMLGVGGETHPAGVMVLEVRQGTAAAAAGIVVGDVISSMDGRAIPDFDRLTVRIAQHQPGDRVDVEIVRNNERMNLTVTLGSWAGQE